MSRQNFSEGQEIVTQDLNAISQGLEETILDNVVWPMLGASAGFFGDGFFVTYDSSTGVTVSEGWGIQRDASQSDPEPMTRILVNDDDSTIYAIETPDGSNDRIDIVQVKAELANGATGTREFKAADGSVGDATAQLRKDWSADIQVKTGTPAGSPSAPSPDSGYVKIAELYVTTSTGIADQDAITDTRARAKIDHSLIGGVNDEQAAAHTLTANSPEDILIDSPSGVVNQDLPSTGVRKGKKFTLHVSGMDSSNYVVLRSSDTDTVHSFDYSADGCEGYITVMALQDEPTDATHWKILRHWAYITIDFRNISPFGAGTYNLFYVVFQNNTLVTLTMKGSGSHSLDNSFGLTAIIPEALRPVFSAQNCYSGDSRTNNFYVAANGNVTWEYRKNSDGTLYDNGSTSGAVSLSWIVV